MRVDDRGWAGSSSTPLPADRGPRRRRSPRGWRRTTRGWRDHRRSWSRSDAGGCAARSIRRPTASSAPARAAVSGSAEEMRRPAQPAGVAASPSVASMLDGVGRDKSRRATRRGTRQLGRGLRAAAPGRAGGVAEGHQAHGTIGLGRVVGGRPGPGRVGVEPCSMMPWWSARTRCHPTRRGPALLGRRAATTRVDRAGRLADGAQRVGGAVEAVRLSRRWQVIDAGFECGGERRGQLAAGR